MGDYTALPRNIKDCMERAGAPLSEDQFMLLTGYLAPVQSDNETLRARVAELEGEALQFVANKVCGELPQGWVVNLCMENGAAWVEAINPSGYTIDIDGGDISLTEQVGEALSLAEEAEKAGGGDA